MLVLACGGRAKSDDPPAPTATGLQVLVEGEKDPTHVAVDERFVYWASPAEVRRAPLEGGAAVILATGSGINSLAVAEEYVYFAASEHVPGQSAERGFIRRVPRFGGDSETIAQMQHPMSVVVGGGRLYWSNADRVETGSEGSLWSAALDGTDARALATGLQPTSTLLADDTSLFFLSSNELECPELAEPSCLGGGVYRLPTTGGPFERVYAARSPVFLAQSARGLWWLEASEPQRILLAPPGGSQREVAELSSFFHGPFAAADAEAVYWSGGAGVMKAPVDGSAVTRIVSGIGSPAGIALWDDWVYLADMGRGRILRVALDGSGNRPSGPITGPCPTPLGTARERAQTPRADSGVELLALALDAGSLTASQATYDRVAADVAALARLAPDLEGIGFIGRNDGKRLLFQLDDVGTLSLAAGEYSAWNCLNDAYGVTSIIQETNDVGSLVTLALQGIYDIPQLVEQYRTLPAVVGVDGIRSDANDAGPELCAHRSGEHYEYVVDRTSGECPGRCEHEAHRFASDAPGQLTALGVWDSRSSEPTPDWFDYRCPLSAGAPGER